MTIKYKCQVECYWAYPDNTTRRWKLGEEVDVEEGVKPPKFFVLISEWRQPAEKMLYRRNRFIGKGGKANQTFTDFAKEHHVMPQPMGLAAGIKQDTNAIPARKGRTQERVAK